jgi:hypothetical protein
MTTHFLAFEVSGSNASKDDSNDAPRSDSKRTLCGYLRYAGDFERTRSHSERGMLRNLVRGPALEPVHAPALKK